MLRTLNANLIHITPRLGHGGAERLMLNLLPLLREAGWRQTVICLLPGGELLDEFKKLAGNDISIEMLDIRKTSPLSYIRGYIRLRNIMKRQPPNSIVQGWLYHGNVAAFCATLFLDKPRYQVWGIHAAGFGPRDFSLASRVMQKLSRLISGTNLDKIIYCSKQAREDHENIGFPTATGSVVENGLNSRLLHSVRSSRRKARQALEITDCEYVVACIARYAPQKDIPNLFAAVDIMPKNKRPTVLMMGTGLSFDNPNFTADFKASGLTWDTCRIKAMGSQSDPFFLMAAADVVVLPSAFGEAQPLALIESLAAGIPIIATSVGGVPELAERIGGKKAVHLVSPKSPVALAKAIIAQQQKLSTISEADRITWQKSIERHFEISRTAVEYDAIYRCLSMPR